MPYVTETLVQNTGETDAAFLIRVNTFISDQAYYYGVVGGGYPPAPFGSRSFKGFPPDKPSSDIVYWDVTSSQMKRMVTFSYEDTYWYIYIGASPPIPGPPPAPAAGHIVIWGPSATLNDGVLEINTLAPNFINLSAATVAGEAVEYSQFTSALSGYVPSTRNITINGVTQDLSADRTWTVAGGVTSVGMSMPGEFSVSGSPVTGSGTLAASWIPVTGGHVLAGPTLGSLPAVPTFRLLNALDIPDISATYLTLSSASSTYVAKSGSTMSGSLILNADPSAALGAATKQYVDNISAGINFHSPVNVATTANLSATYLNGSGGAGATLTATSNGALVIDGQSMSATQRVLVWQQSSGIENGIYNVTDAGSPTTPFILTRSADADNVPPGEIIYGDFVLTLSGTLYGGFGFICNTPGTITIGTTSISYIQYNVAQAVSAGYGLQELTANVLSVDSSVIATVSSLGSYLTSATAAATYYPLTNPSGYISGITSGDVTTALGFTPYSNTNPSGFISSITSGDVTTALGFTPYSNTNPSGYISGITSGDVTTALGFTPYSNANPSGFITSAALSGYLTSATAALTYFPIPTGTVSQYIRGNGSLATFPTIPTVTPSALTEVDDTNVTITLGGTPSTALLQPVSITAGWTGTLADSRITSATTWNNKSRLQYNNSTATQAITAATITYLTGSNITTANIQAGTVVTWTVSVTKTAAGTAAPLFSVRFGTTSTTADAIILNFTGNAQTAIADTGEVTIQCTFRTVGSGTSAVLVGHYKLVHVLPTTGLSTGNGGVFTTSAGFNSTTASSFLGLTLNTGASAAWTVNQVNVKIENIV
jgi:hypothetical protein